MTISAGLTLALAGALLVGPPPRPVEAQPAPSATPADWKVCKDLEQRADGHTCSTTSCGSNTPFINTFPIDGVNPGGCQNADGDRLEPGSLSVGRSTCKHDGLTLDVDDRGRLVGRDPTTGAVQCEGVALLGVVFSVTAAREKTVVFQTPHTTRIMISQMGTISEGARKVTGYVFSPENDPSRSLCAAADKATWLAGWLGSPPPEINADYYPPIVTRNALPTVSDGERGRYAILIAGDVFKRDADAFKNPQHWFNIACADSALAKMRLRGLDTAKPSLAARKAALRMLTAKYRDGVSYTTAGVTIEWRGREDEGVGVQSRLEARWGEDGATCLSHSRLWRVDVAISADALGPGPECRLQPCTEQIFLSNIRGNIPVCDGTDEPKPGEYWSSYVVDHIED